MEEERSGSGSGLANGGGSSMSGVRVSNGREVEGQGVVAFPLSPASVLKIQKGDITRWSVDGSSDAIVSLSPFLFVNLYAFYRLCMDKKKLENH